MYFTSLFALMLQTAQLKIDHATINVEIADTPSARKQGLMGREALSDNSGMLFVFEKSEILSFWMKDTKIPLSIGFFDKDKKLLQIEDMTPPLDHGSSLKTYTSRAPAQYALEVPQNWFTRNKITPGMKFSLHDLQK